MGFFSRLFGKSDQPTVADRIWMSGPAKMAALLDDLLPALEAGPVVLLAHFPDTFRILQKALDQSGTSYAHPPGPLAPGAVREGITLARVAQLESGGVLPGPAVRPTAILVGERHPLPDQDQRVVDFAAALGSNTNVRFYIAVDDPLLKQLAGDWLAPTLQKLGMKETDALDSPMLSRRIVAAQKKMASRAIANQPADSCEQWIELNLQR